MNSKIIYLAGPYSHPMESVRIERFERLSRFAGLMLANGFWVYSPISHSHPIAMECPELGLSWDAWRTLDLAMLARCDAMWVLMLPGWKESSGVSAEIESATAAQIPVAYVVEDLFTKILQPVVP